MINKPLKKEYKMANKEKPSRPMFTKWRKNKGQFARKDFHKELPKKIAEYLGRKEVSHG
jgi:hypothetical protein